MINMKKINKFILFICLIVNGGFLRAAVDNIPERPNPPRLINNFSKELPNFLSSAEQQQLENKLKTFSDSTSNQIAIVIVDDLGDYDANEYATHLGQKWGVGQGKFDNGIVILIKPTGGSGRRDIYIAVGNGLEGAIPDITAKQIVENEIKPNFKNGQNYQGLNIAIDVLMGLAKGEFNSKDYAKSNYSKPRGFPFGLVIIGVFFLVFIFLKRNNGGQSIGTRGGGFYGGFGGGGGNWSDFSSGGGSFGGFGGGSFGGGGAGGNW